MRKWRLTNATLASDAEDRTPSNHREGRSADGAQNGQLWALLLRNTSMVSCPSFVSQRSISYAMHKIGNCIPIETAIPGLFVDDGHLLWKLLIAHFHIHHSVLGLSFPFYFFSLILITFLYIHFFYASKFIIFILITFTINHSSLFHSKYLFQKSFRPDC